MSERVFYPDTNDVSSTSKVVALSIAVFRFNASTLHVATASLIRTADQVRGKVGLIRTS
jgi:hypothetical protein